MKSIFQNFITYRSIKFVYQSNFALSYQ